MQARRARAQRLQVVGRAQLRRAQRAVGLENRGKTVGIGISIAANKMLCTLRFVVSRSSTSSSMVPRATIRWTNTGLSYPLCFCRIGPMRSMICSSFSRSPLEP